MIATVGRCNPALPGSLVVLPVPLAETVLLPAQRSVRPTMIVPSAQNVLPVTGWNMIPVMIVAPTMIKCVTTITRPGPR